METTEAEARPFRPKSGRMQQLEEEFGKPIEAILEEMQAEHATREVVALKLSISYPTLRLWERRFGTRMRDGRRRQGFRRASG